VKRLRALEVTPEQVLEKSEELLQRSRIEFGERFKELEEIYPEYEKWADAEERRQNEWQARCLECRFWSTEMQGSDLWCQKHTFDSKAYPGPCLEYEVCDDMPN